MASFENNGKSMYSIEVKINEKKQSVEPDCLGFKSQFPYLLSVNCRVSESSMAVLQFQHL